MAFDLPKLPFAENALEPYISAQTIQFHYGKHHRTYVENLNKLIHETAFDKMSLVQIIQETAGKAEYAPIFNNAAQAFNHEFFFNNHFSPFILEYDTKNPSKKIPMIKLAVTYESIAYNFKPAVSNAGELI